ncbi:glycoside hydrolase family 16 protein [Gammaproteobacteria bacterium]|nr:glycoside hydrolase family 16 protein [Gammaproteobacteria bacterium]
MIKNKYFIFLLVTLLTITSTISNTDEKNNIYDYLPIDKKLTTPIESDDFLINKKSYCRKRNSSEDVTWFEDFSDKKLNKADWNYSISNGFYDNGLFVYGWGNGELQYYREPKKNSQSYINDNLFIEDGFLKIQPIYHQKAYKKNFDFTSARINTKGLRSFTFPSRITVCFKVPTGIGAWPAIWLMPQSNISWPKGGEIDIMESRGRVTNILGSALHFGNSFFDKATLVNDVIVPPSVNFQEKFHSITFEWQQDTIKMYLDSEALPYMSISNEQEDFNKYEYPFGSVYYLIVNVAVGGKYDNYKIDQQAFCKNKQCTNKDNPDQHRLLIDWIEYARINN